MDAQHCVFRNQTTIGTTATTTYLCRQHWRFVDDQKRCVFVQQVVFSGHVVTSGKSSGVGIDSQVRARFHRTGRQDPPKALLLHLCDILVQIHIIITIIRDGGIGVELLFG